MLKIKLLFKYVSVNPIETSSIHFHVVCFDKLVVQSTAKKTFLKHQQKRVEAHTLSLSPIVEVVKHQHRTKQQQYH